MEPKEKLKELELKLIEKLLKKFEDMLDGCDRGVFHKDCKISHLEELTKLAHRVRSLLG